MPYEFNPRGLPSALKVPWKAAPHCVENDEVGEPLAPLLRVLSQRVSSVDEDAVRLLGIEHRLVRRAPQQLRLPPVTTPTRTTLVHPTLGAVVEGGRQIGPP